MRDRSFIALLAVTVMLAAAAIYSVSQTGTTAQMRVDGERMFPDLAKSLSDLTWMRLSHGDARIEFAAIAGKWVVVEKGNYPAAPSKVRRLLLGLADLTLLEAKTQRPELFGRLNVEDPGAASKGTLVQLQNRIGVPVVNLIVGKVRRDRGIASNDTVYVRKPGENRAWLARGSLDVSGDAVHWLDRRIIDIPPSRVASLMFAGDDQPLVLRRADPAAEFAVADPPPDTQFKSGRQIAEPAAALAGLDFDDVRPATDAPPAGGDERIVTFETFDGLTVAVRLSSAAKDNWVTITVTGSGAAAQEARSIMTSLGRWSFALPPDRLKLLRTRLADLTLPPKGS